MLKNLEHHEHAEHMAHGHGHGGHDHGADPDARRNQFAALLVAVLAAGLALTEQGARRAEIAVQEYAIFATDSWAQYQAKSIRGTAAKNLAEIVGILGPATDPALADRRRQLQERLLEDQRGYETDPKDGKGAIAKRAIAFEHQRDHTLEQTHAFHNAAAGMELGIVLSTASAIIKSKLLIWMAFGIGLLGGVFAILGVVKPELGASVFGLFADAAVGH
jgi:hypothetical protein